MEASADAADTLEIRMGRSLQFALCLTVAGWAFLFAPAMSAANKTNPHDGGPAKASVKVIRIIPKSAGAFTEGLEVHGGIIYESTGLFGKSEMRAVDLKTGKVVNRVPLAPLQFGEGVTLAPTGRLVQLTWKNKEALVRNLKSLKQIGSFQYEGEGWGLCFSSMRKAFVQSDGSSRLTLRDPTTFKKISAIPVTISNESPPNQINELECDGRTVLANIWMTNRIVVIDLETGRVIRIVDASSIAPTGAGSPDDVLNGIARLGPGRYLLTGKRWPAYYEVSFVDAK